MKNKRMLIVTVVITIIISIIIDCATGFMVFLDYLAERKTISVDSQQEQIVQEIKEHFDIEYDIEKITFMSGMPDGYYLTIYDENNEERKYFEDNHEDSEIYEYFKDKKADKSKYAILLIIEVIIEVLLIRFIILRLKNKKEHENG